MDFWSDSETEEDFRAEISDEILIEIEEDRKLNIIKKFKDYVKKIPELGWIDNLSSYSILNIIEAENKQLLKNKMYLEPFIYEIFDELFKSLYGKTALHKEYLDIYNQIYKKLYIF
tara:strand:+ start:255 stop:602 length:348 start_codon:yes stop_codon:yes gene_type:complete